MRTGAFGGGLLGFVVLRDMVRVIAVRLASQAQFLGLFIPRTEVASGISLLAAATPILGFT
jgi:hypothetical protein